MHHNGVHHDLVVLVARIVHDEEPVDEAPDAATTAREELADSQTGISDVEAINTQATCEIERMRAVVGSLSCEVYINKESSSSVMRLRRSASCAAVKNFALVARNILILF